LNGGLTHSGERGKNDKGEGNDFHEGSGVKKEGAVIAPSQRFISKRRPPVVDVTTWRWLLRHSSISRFLGPNKSCDSLSWQCDARDKLSMIGVLLQQVQLAPCCRE